MSATTDPVTTGAAPSHAPPRNNARKAGPALAQVPSSGQSANWTPVAWMCAGFVVAAAVAALTGPETFRTPTAELGGTR